MKNRRLAFFELVGIFMLVGIAVADVLPTRPDPRRPPQFIVMDADVDEMGTLFMGISIVHLAALSFGLAIVKWNRNQSGFLR